MRVLICGGRNFSDFSLLSRTLDKLHTKRPFTAVAQGGAAGADFLAKQWAITRGIPAAEYAADWRTDGKGAGPRRNARMLAEFKPDLVVAFRGGHGTADMVRRARDAGVEVVEPRFTVSLDWVDAAWKQK